MLNKKDLGLYIHVPFCLTKCSYCGFFSQPPSSDSPERYVERLFQEMSQRLDVVSAQRVRTVFIGGGNPTALGPKLLGKIVDHLLQKLSEAVITEWTLETNPETLTSEVINVLCQIPALRLSIGLQRLKDDELSLLGRSTRADIGVQALENSFRATDNVGIDIILGVPGLPSVAGDLSRLVGQFPVSHISTYFLTIEENTPLAHEVQAGRFPDPAETGPEEYFEVADAIKTQGFLPYEISNFSRPGMECRHNLHYWHQGDYLGIGPAAVSTVNSERIANPDSLQAWISGNTRTEQLSLEERQREYVMLRLRLLSEGLSPSDYISRFGAISNELVQGLETLTVLGKLTRTRHGYCLSREGLVIANQVISELF